MAEDWEQYYSGFSSNYAPNALQTVNQAQFNTYTPTTNTAPQTLVSPDNSYARLRGWSPDPNAMGNSGPRMTNFIQSDGLAARGALDGNGLGADYNDMDNAPYGGPSDPYGGLDVSALYQSILGRNADPSGLAAYGGLPSGQVAQALLSSQEYQNRLASGGATLNPGNADVSPTAFGANGATMPNNLNPAGGAALSQDEIASLYQQYLGRAPDAAGAQWAGGLDAGTLAKDLQGSSEYQASHPAINLGMGDTSPTKAVNPYGDLSGVNVTNPYGDLTGSNVNPTQPPTDFKGTTAGLSLDSINQLWQQYLGRPADAAGAAWAGGLDVDTLSKDLQASPEYQQSHPANFDVNGPVNTSQPGDMSHLNSLYQQFLGRDADPSGAGFYSGQSDDQITNALKNSQEYQQRVASGGAGLDANGQPTYTNGVGVNGAQYDDSQNARGSWSDPNFLNSQWDALGDTFNGQPYQFDRTGVQNAYVPSRTTFDQLPQLSDADLLRVARTMFGEARGETDPNDPTRTDPNALAAVASVIRNRLATVQIPGLAKFGNSIDEVTRPSQFSTWDGNNPDNAQNFANMLSMGPNNPQWQSYVDTINGVWNGTIADPTQGAVNYYNPQAALPNWAQQLANQNDVSIGHHRFVGRTPLYPVPILPPPRPADLGV